ncbi:hypothetical protein [Leptospira saintgironsiae]|nr:hypothetical protein [Leptospira saintgironsiae]
MIIYLDQNKWIDLARVRSGSPEGQKYQEVYQKIKEKVSTGEWKFPLSSVHYMEVFAIRDPVQRKNLIDTMLEIGGRFYIRPYLVLQLIELQKQIALKLDIPAPEHSPFSNSFCELLGIDPSQLKIEGGPITKLLSPNFDYAAYIENLPDPFSFMLSSGYKKEDLEKLSEIWQNSIAELEDLKAELSDLSDKDKLEKLLIKSFHSEIEHRLSHILNQIGVNATVIEEMIQDKERLVSILQLVPTLNLHNRLKLRHFKNKSKKTHRNDIKDFAFLASALPYVDIVIAEKLLVSYSKQEKIESEYNVKISNDLNFLLSL